MDFITSLPLYSGYNAIFTCVGHFTEYVCLTHCSYGRVNLVPHNVPSSSLTRQCSFLVFLMKWLVTGIPHSPATSGQSCGAFWELLCNSVQPIAHKVMSKPNEHTIPWNIAYIVCSAKLAFPTRGGVKFSGM